MKKAWNEFHIKDIEIEMKNSININNMKISNLNHNIYVF